MDGWLIYGWIDRWLINGWTDLKWMDEYTSREMDGSMKGLINE